MDIKELQNVYEGLPIFIVGAGPSIRYVDFNLIKDLPSIAINSGILADRNIDYFLSDDIAVTFWNYYIEYIKNIDCFCLLYKNKLLKHSNHISEDRKLFFNHCSRFRMCYDLSKPIIKARTSMGTAVNIAYGMGANKIFLLGCDCSIEKNKRYFWEYYHRKDRPRKIKGTKHLNNKILKDDKYEYPVDKHSKAFIRYWNRFYRENKDILNDEVEIINASYGNLECFKKIKPEEIDNYL
ncbi:MAG: hypothetical protein ACOCP8_07500 [archaeon]